MFLSDGFECSVGQQVVVEGGDHVVGDVLVVGCCLDDGSFVEGDCFADGYVGEVNIFEVVNPADYRAKIGGFLE